MQKKGELKIELSAQPHHRFKKAFYGALKVLNLEGFSMTRVMVFIDGGYLREGFKRIFKHDRIAFFHLFGLFSDLPVGGGMYSQTIRTYYYDAIVNPEEDFEKYKEQKEYYSEIDKYDGYVVKLARLKKTESRMKQKGADVMLAVDMISKAFLDHYDIAIILTGDDDFLDLVKTVKELTDKRVWGAYYPDHISEDLQKSFDSKIRLTKNLLEKEKIEKNEG